MRHQWAIVVITACICSSASLSWALSFDPVFRLLSFDGTCQVRTPSAARYVDAEEGKAYPYGTLLKTGPESRARLGFSSQDWADMGPNTEIRCVDYPTPGAKVVKAAELFSGKLDVRLSRNFSEQNGLHVITHCTDIAAVAGPAVGDDAPSDAASLKFGVSANQQDSMKAILVGCDQGEISLSGPQYTVPSLTTKQMISVTCTFNRGFIRLRGEAGEFALQVMDSDMNPRLVDMAGNASVKILQKSSSSGDATIVTVLEIGKDNKPVRADSYQTSPEPDNLLPEAPAAGGRGGGEMPTDSRETKPQPAPDGAWVPIEETTTTTSTTTTTTIPELLRIRTVPAAPTTTTRPRTTTTTTTTTTTKPEATSVGEE